MFVIYEYSIIDFKLVYDYRVVISFFCIFIIKLICILNQYNVFEIRGYVKVRNLFLFFDYEINGCGKCKNEIKIKVVSL